MMQYLSFLQEACSRPAGKHFEGRRKLILGGGALSIAALVCPVIAIAQAKASDEPRKINFSGRQRMLIQRAGKLVCLAGLSPDPLPLLAAAEETLKLHQRTEVGLRDGDEGLGLEPETNALVLKALMHASNIFAPFGEAIYDAIERHSVEPGDLQKIALLNGYALNAMDAAVSIIERVYQNNELSEQLAMLINISGRQRMFTQRMVLQLCLYRSGTKSEGSLQEFFRTMNRFNLSFNILRRVTPVAVTGEMRTPIIEALDMARSEWETLGALMSRAIRSASIHSFDDMRDIDRRAENLLGKLNEIVLLYEGVAA